MTTEDPDEEGGVYRLAPEPPIGVSTAAACEGHLDGSRKEAVKAYLKTLGPALQDRYGRREHYTPNQVRDTVVGNGLAIDYTCWAFMLYCSPVDVAGIHAAAGGGVRLLGHARGGGRCVFRGEPRLHHGRCDIRHRFGGGEVVAAGAGGVVGWLADVDWGGLLDWS